MKKSLQNASAKENKNGASARNPVCLKIPPVADISNSAAQKLHKVLSAVPELSPVGLQNLAYICPPPQAFISSK